MMLNGLVRKIVDPRSGYTAVGIAHNDYELSVLVNQLIDALHRDFGPDYDISQITIS